MTIQAIKLLKISVMVIGAVVALFIAGLLFCNRPNPADWLKVNFVGETNDHTGAGAQAIFAVSNFSDTMIEVSFTPELKEPDWPVYGPGRPLQPLSIFFVPAHQATNVPVPVPSGRGLWRLRVSCYEQRKESQNTRIRWAAWLRTQKLDWLANRINPVFTGGLIETAEMTR